MAQAIATDNQGWDVACEWHAMLFLSLAFGLVGPDWFVLTLAVPNHDARPTLRDQDLGTFVGALGMARDLSAVVVGKFAQHFGIQYTLCLALGGEIVVLSVRGFLYETAPRLAHRNTAGRAVDRDGPWTGYAGPMRAGGNRAE